MDEPGTAALLAEVDFFKGCTKRQIEDIAKLVGSRHLEPGEVLCRQGDHESDVFVLVDGEARVVIDGKEVAAVGTGEVVGELAMDRGGLRTATLTAKTPLHVLVLDPREVDSVLASDPHSATNLGPRHPRTTHPAG
jgi:CRP-like cAMP-binding protein